MVFEYPTNLLDAKFSFSRESVQTQPVLELETDQIARFKLSVVVCESCNCCALALLPHESSKMIFPEMEVEMTRVFKKLEDAQDFDLA